MGFILSVSSLQIKIPLFKTGTTVVIKTKEIGRMDLTSTFQGEILLNDEQVMEGKLTVMEVNEEQARAMKEGAYAIQ
jgi:predicted hotdog family 3-hydroxylacyl-ACP dehydratase